MLIQFNHNPTTEPYTPSPTQDTQKLVARLAEKISCWSQRQPQKNNIKRPNSSTGNKMYQIKSP